MANFFFFAAMACLFGVVSVFALGIFAMTRGQEKDHKTSNKMMRLRVLFQGLTILFLFLAYVAK